MLVSRKQIPQQLVATIALSCQQAACGVKNPRVLRQPIRNLVDLQAADVAHRAAEHLNEDCLDDAKVQLRTVHIDGFATMNRVGRPPSRVGGTLFPNDSDRSDVLKH